MASCVRVGAAPSPLARRPMRAVAAAALLAGAWALAACDAAASADAPPADAKPAAPAAKSDSKPPEAKPPSKPITTAKGRLGDLVRRWYAEGTAAGNEGDYYDNRDRGHSGLNLEPYPQLTKVEYTEEDRKRGLDWAIQGRVLPHVVFGNSSTSGHVTAGGSNARIVYGHPMGLALLYAQYTHSNLYIYPEHQDYDAGHNGSPGYGDVYPTNTPCLIISQGSSGSDQAFMRAIPFALAALRPEVKKKLVESGLLAPTLQMILRLTSKRLADPKEYLTGKAHPTVFEGSWVDDLKMVELAHKIRLEDIPPMVQLRRVEEAEAVNGRDYFDIGPGEQLGETPVVIARVHRRSARDYRLVVSAEASYDVNQRPLAYHWVVLRGDASRIRLTPQNPAGSACEIIVPWHERRPVEPGSALESNRVDVGVFVHNGEYYSAPAFVTFLGLDDEARTYAGDGRVLEIGYGLGVTEVSVANWTALLDLFKADAAGLGARLLKKRFKDEEIAAVLKIAQEYRTAKATADAGQEMSRKAQAARQKAAEALKAAERLRDEAKAAHEKSPGNETKAALDKAEAACPEAKTASAKGETDANDLRKAAEASAKTAADILNTKRDGLPAPVKDLVERLLTDMATNPTFGADYGKEIAALFQGAEAGRKAALEAARRRLVGFGLIQEAPADAFNLRPARDGAAPAVARLTRYEQALLEQFNAEVLGRVVFPGTANFSTKRNYADPRLATPKTWRDVYRYGPKGDGIGWTRYDGQRATEFNAWGLVVLEKDALGRCVKAQAVRYERENPAKQQGRPPSGPLRQVLDPGITRYEYADNTDWRGRVRTDEPPAGAR